MSQLEYIYRPSCRCNRKCYARLQAWQRAKEQEAKPLVLPRWETVDDRPAIETHVYRQRTVNDQKDFGRRSKHSWRFPSKALSDRCQVIRSSWGRSEVGNCLWFWSTDDTSPAVMRGGVGEEREREREDMLGWDSDILSCSCLVMRLVSQGFSLEIQIVGGPSPALSLQIRLKNWLLGTMC
jgi:hypothetical protein